jgi:hypothetical protein
MLGRRAVADDERRRATLLAEAIVAEAVQREPAFEAARNRISFRKPRAEVHDQVFSSGGSADAHVRQSVLERADEAIAPTAIDETRAADMAVIGAGSDELGPRRRSSTASTSRSVSRNSSAYAPHS